MKLIRNFLIWILVILCLTPAFVSCSEKKEPSKDKENTKTEQKETKEEETEDLSFGDALRKSIKVDPMYGDMHPSEDEELNILLIGNSYSTHWPDELANLLGAGGYESVLVCDIYHSGATFEQHWTWMQNNESVEAFHINRPGKEKKTWEDVRFDECLPYANWDIISFQQSNRLAGSTDRYRKSIADWLPQLYSYVYALFPDATYYWQQNWSHSAGKDGYGSYNTVEKMTKWFEQEAELVCADWGFINAPLGDAWVDVRYDPLFYSYSGDLENENPTKSLHTRIYESSSYKGTITNADLSHDGNIGGGQYLNACVWYEMITHKSVIGNSFVPQYYHEATNTTYTFTAEQISVLQNAAHNAVLAEHGEAFYTE